MPKRATIEDVRAAGFTCRLASGSVAVEEEALEMARRQAAPEAIKPAADDVASAVARLADQRGVIGQARVELVARAAADALATISAARDETVAFHERALEIAKAMPDVWFVSALGDPETPDDDVRIYVACKADGTGWDDGAQEMLDALVESGPP